MESPHDSIALTLIRRVHQLAWGFGLAMGSMALIGWSVGLERLHSPLPQLGTMAPLAAVAFVLASLSVWLWQKPQAGRRKAEAQLCGCLVMLIGLLYTGCYLWIWSLPSALHHFPANGLLARLLMPEQQMAFTTALSLTLLGGALAVLDSRAKNGASPAERLVLGAAFVPFAALVAHIYGVRGFTIPLSSPFSPGAMSLYTTLCLLAFFAAVLTARPERGWMARFLSNRPEGLVARRLWPSGVAALLALGWLTESGEQIGLYSHDDGAAIFVAMSALTFGLLIRHSMKALSALEASREKTEASLRRSEEHLRMALEAAHVGTWELNVQTNELRWSDAVATIFSLSKGTFTGPGDSFLKLIHPDDRDLVQTRAVRAFQGTEPYHVEYRIVCPDNTVRWVASRGEVFRDQNGFPLRMAGTSMDITERRLLERELIEASNREQRRLGQDLHDDLGQWLTAIHLETRALAMRLKARSEPDAEHAERIVTCIREALERTRMLARGMTPAVIESGGLSAALHELTASTERMFRTSCHCICSEHLTVRNAESALQLYRIAQEAISNAIRHGNATEIIIRLELADRRRARLIIRDNGSGIPQPLPRTAGLGLHTMRYRAGLLSATLDILPVQGGGTQVTCSFSSEL